MTRTIALLGLAQLAVVICGFFGLSIVLKHYGYSGQPPQGISSFGVYHWSLLTLFLRRYGMVLLLVPVSWAIFAVISERRGRFGFSSGGWLLFGTIIPFVIIMMFFYAIFHPCIYVATN